MHRRKMVARIIVDIFIVIIGLFIITVIRALFPSHLPNKYTPKDLGFDYKKVTFHATDGKNLSGWLIYSSEALGTIICCHGYPANKSDILPVVSFLYPEFNLFLFDFRGHGDSQGRFVSFGLREDRDILGAIDYIKENPKINKLPVGIWGYSFGGAVAIKACTQNRQIKAIVTDSTYASFPEMITQYYGNLGPLKYLFGSGGKLLGKIFLKGGLSGLSPEEFISSLNTPILIIHASNDPFVPVEHARRLYRRANQPKELLVLSDTMHGVSVTEEYKDKIKTFFEECLFKKQKNLPLIE
jgi:pimeloyl-ACP methyl ester carboxylesterase